MTRMPFYFLLLSYFRTEIEGYLAIRSSYRVFRFSMLFPCIINQGKSDAFFIFLYLVWKNGSRKLLHILDLLVKLF